MEIARMTSKGQLTIPLSIRKKLGLDTGDQLLFYERNGQVIIAPMTPAALSDAQIAAAEQHVYSLEEIKEIVEPIARKYGLSSMKLFGSYARNEATPSSDLDFCYDTIEKFSLFKMGGLQADLEEAFHKSIDLISTGMLEDELSGGLNSNIEEDGVLIYGSKQ